MNPELWTVTTAVRNQLSCCQFYSRTLQIFYSHKPATRASYSGGVRWCGTQPLFTTTLQIIMLLVVSRSQASSTTFRRFWRHVRQEQQRWFEHRKRLFGIEHDMAMDTRAARLHRHMRVQLHCWSAPINMVLLAKGCNKLLHNFPNTRHIWMLAKSQADTNLLRCVCLMIVK